VALLLGPVLFGISFGVITYLATASLGLVGKWHDAAAWVFRVISFLFATGLFWLLYLKVPNKAVQRSHALVGGLIAAAGFALMQWLFASYITGMASYRIVYGAFAAIPIFLGWLYCSWGVILVGALITAELPAGKRGR
jgi:membrane protein